MKGTYHKAVGITIYAPGRPTVRTRPRPPDYEAMNLRRAGLILHGPEPDAAEVDADSGEPLTGWQVFAREYPSALTDSFVQRAVLAQRTGTADASGWREDGLHPRDVIDAILQTCMDLVRRISPARRGDGYRPLTYIAQLQVRCNTVEELLTAHRTSEAAHTSDGGEVPRRWIWNSGPPAVYKARPLVHKQDEMLGLWEKASRPTDVEADALHRMSEEGRLLTEELEGNQDELRNLLRARNTEDDIAADVHGELRKTPLNPIGAIMRALGRHEPSAAPKHRKEASGSLTSLFPADDTSKQELFGDIIVIVVQSVRK